MMTVKTNKKSVVESVVIGSAAAQLQLYLLE